MGTKKSPLPIYRADRFDFGLQAEAMERFVPTHHNRTPAEEERDHHRWGLEGILSPQSPDNKILLAVNITDVRDPKTDELLIEGQELAVMFATARFRRLTQEFPGLEQMDGNEAGILIPRAALQPLYAEGMSVAPESVFPDPVPVADPAGRIATGNSGGIVPVPAFNPA